MTKTEELLLRIEKNQAGIEKNQINLEAHEKECAVRYEMIQRQLDEGGKKFDKLERMIMSMYPFILASIVIAEYFR